MSISSFTNAVGVYDHYSDPVFNTLDANNFHQEQMFQYRDGFSLKYGPNKDGSHSTQKSYRRLIVKVTDFDAAVFVDTDPSYPKDPSRYKRYFAGSLDIDEPAEWTRTRENMEDKTSTGVRNNLRKGNLDLGPALGEAKQTLGMISGATSTTVRAVLAARRKNWREVADILQLSRRRILTGQYPANKWLEYQYGWKPLMSDIYAGGIILRNGLRDPAFRIYSAKSVTNETKVFPVEYSGGAGLIKGEKTFKATSKTCVFYKISNRTIDSLDSLGLINPLSVAWELVPFSFVADWFIPVGNTLSSLTATAGLEFVDGYKTMYMERSQDLRTELVPGTTYRSLSNPGRYRSEAMEVIRTKLVSFPAPKLYANMHPFSDAHVANAIALIRQLL